MRGSQIPSIGKIKLKRIFLIILSVIVLLAGAGHVRKGAIPRQIREPSGVAHAVILPVEEGSMDPNTASMEDAEYLMLDL